MASKNVDTRPAYSKEDEAGLCFAGFVTFFDPPLPEAAETLAEMRRDGVEVKIVTGDNELVTRYICERVGLDGSAIVLGDDLEI